MDPTHHVAWCRLWISPSLRMFTVASSRSVSNTQQNNIQMNLTTITSNNPRLASVWVAPDVSHSSTYSIHWISNSLRGVIVSAAVYFSATLTVNDLPCIATVTSRAMFMLSAGFASWCPVASGAAYRSLEFSFWQHSWN